MNRKALYPVVLIAVLALGWSLGNANKERPDTKSAKGDTERPDRPASQGRGSNELSAPAGMAPDRRSAPRSMMPSRPLPPVGGPGTLPDPRREALVAQHEQFLLEDVANRKGKVFDQFAATTALDAETFQSLTNLLAKRELGFMTGLAGRRDENGRMQPPSREEVASYRKETSDQVQALLTPEQFEQYEDYSRTVPERAIVEMVRNLNPEEAISADQQNQLVDILYEARQGVIESGISSPEDLAQKQKAAFAEALAQSESVLSPATQTALADVLEELSSPKGPKLGALPTPGAPGIGSPPSTDPN